MLVFSGVVGIVMTEPSFQSGVWWQKSSGLDMATTSSLLLFFFISYLSVSTPSFFSVKK
jgi:hypothetical protein